MRVINHSDEAGEVVVKAYDDSGLGERELRLEIGAGQARHFNSQDAEKGNPDKQWLAGTLARGTGDWRLTLASELDIEALSYLRTTSDGFLASMHDTVPADIDAASDQHDDDGTDGQVHRYDVVIVNPGKNTDQESLLRFVNPGDEDATITVKGTDDTGNPGDEDVTVDLSAGASATLSARELEQGGDGLEGRLGTGDGKWRFTVASDREILVMNLLQSPGGHITNLSSVPKLGQEEAHRVNLFPGADDPDGRQGFVRVINHGDSAAEVDIVALDETEREYSTLTLTVRAMGAVHFNSDDLELGNEEKGLAGSTGPGEGDWQLELSSEADIQVLAYIRTSDGFLTSMHDAVPGVDNRHRVPIFNPGRNVNQVSRLRLINAGDEDARVTIKGVDDEGRSGKAVRTVIGRGDVRSFTAAELESGVEGLDGTLGTGSGKWHLIVESDRAITVVSLLESPTGHLTNLSTSPRNTDRAAE